MIKTGRVSQNSAMSAIVGSWNVARLDFQMHIARRFQNGGLGPHFFEHSLAEIGPFCGPWLLRTWRRHLCSQLCRSWSITDRTFSQFCCYFGQSTLPSIYIFYFCPCESMMRLNCPFFTESSVFWFIEYHDQHMYDLEDKSKIIISTTLSKWCSVVCSMFFVFHCQME